MQRRSLIESYALAACLLALACFLAALYYLGLGIIAREAPEYTINRYRYDNHQTNERYWAYSGDRRPRPPEDALTAERERSWRAELELERREGTRAVWLSAAGAVASAVVFAAHWRVAHRARREEPPAGERVLRPLALAAAVVFGLACSCCSGLAAGLLAGAVGDHGTRFEEEFRAINPVLSDPAFAEVEVRRQSDGRAALSGVVPTESDLERLRAQVAHALGARRGEAATLGVRVRRVGLPPER